MSLLGGAVAGVGSLVGGVVGGLSSRASAKQNYEAQKEFAQNGIRWKVEDAKRAGIHPLYALGANTAQFSPSSSYGGDFGISDAFSQFGQGISRAVQAKQTKEERAQEQANADRAFNLQAQEVTSRIEENKAHANYYNMMALNLDPISQSAVASNQAVSRTGLPVAMPDQSADGVSSIAADHYNYTNSPTGETIPFYTLARQGKRFFTVINPAISDSVTENVIANYGTQLAAEDPETIEALRREAYRFMDEDELKDLASGKLELAHIPGLGFELREKRFSSARAELAAIQEDFDATKPWWRRQRLVSGFESSFGHR